MSNLTKAQAEAAYKRVCKQLGETPHPIVEQGAGSWPTGPVLCRNYEGWYSTSRWAIVWEGGPSEWTLYEGTNEVANSATVFAEPINGYCLGLYPTS